MTEKPSSLASVMLARDAAPSQGGNEGAAALRECVSAEDILFAKGAATAAGFNPQYRVYDYGPGPRAPAFDAAEPQSPPRAALQPFQAAVLAFGCMALLLSAALFVNSRSAGPRVAAPAPPASVALQPELAAIVAPQPELAATAPEPELPTVEPPAAETPPVQAPSVQVPPPRTPVATGAEDFVARGSTLLATGDIAAARLFFERAAEVGDGHAALLLGLTFDPAYLSRVGARGMRGDADQAESWYRRARDLGDPDAQRLLDFLAARRTLEASGPIDLGVTPP